MVTQPTHPPAARGTSHVVLIYAVFAALWILLSDQVVTWLVSDPGWIALVNTAKGWLFVAVTSLLLYGLLNRRRQADAGSRGVAEKGASRRVMAPVVAAVAILAGFGASATYVRHRDMEAARLQAIAEFKVSQLSDWLQGQQAHAEFLRGSENYAEQYRRWQQSGDAAMGERLTDRLAQARWDGGFDAVALFAPGDRFLWGTEEGPQATPPVLLAAMVQAGQDGQVHRVGPYLDGAGRPRLDFVAPLTAGGEAPPLLVLRILPTEWLYPTLQAWPVPTATGEVQLFQRLGDQVMILNELRHRQDTAMKLVFPIDAQEGLAAQVLRGEAGLGRLLSGHDYRDMATLGVARGVPGTDWLLIAKIDRNEVVQATLPDLLWIGLASLLSLGMAGVVLRVIRQRAQLALAEGVHQSQNERLEALGLLDSIANSSEDAIYAKDLDGRYILCNEAACSKVGLAKAAILGHDDSALFPEEQARRIQAADRQLMAEPCPMINIQERLRTVQGEREFLTTKGPLRGADGQVAGVFGISRDITDLKTVDQALRDSEARFRALVEQALAGIYMIQDGLFRYVNPAFARMFGHPSAEAMMERVRVADIAAPEDLDRVMTNVQLRTSGRIPSIRYTFTAVRRDGTRFPMEVHGSRFDYEGRPAVIGLALDITARNDAEDALRAQSEELARRNEELERFNRAMVGRELDMLTLKQQVNTLSRALGREASYPLLDLDALVAEGDGFGRPS